MKTITLKIDLSVKQILIKLFVILPIIVFFTLFYKYTVDFPINDDYGVTLGFLNDFLNADTINGKISSLLEQCNEHRIVYDKIWTIVSYKLFGLVNFNFLSLIGNLSLVFIFYIFYKEFKKLKLSLLLLIPFTVLIFNISFWENMTYPMATMSNFTVFVFSILSLRYITIFEKNNNTEFYLSILFLFCGLFTQGSAILVVPLSVAILIYHKRYKNLLIYLIICSIILGIYFFSYGYQRQEHDFLTSLVENKFLIIKYICAFLGSAFNYYTAGSNNTAESLLLTTIIGGLLFIVYAYILFSKYYKKNLFIFSVISLIILIATVTAISRSQLGIETASSSRYRINSVIFIVGIFYWFIETFKPTKKISIILILLPTVYYFFYVSYRQEEYLSIRKKEVLTGILNYYSGRPEKLSGDSNYLNQRIEILNRSNEEEIYFMPTRGSLEDYFPYSKEVNVKQEFVNSSKMGFSVDNVSNIFDGYIIDGWGFINEKPTKNQTILIGLKDINSKTKFFTTKQTDRFDLNTYFKKDNLQQSGFIARINYSSIEKGTYSIIVKIISEDESETIETDKKLIY